MNRFTFIKICKQQLLTLVFIILPLVAQTLYVPTNDDVYDFLERSHLRSLSTYSEIAIPISRLLVAKHLIEIAGKRELLSKEEEKELAYYEQEYRQELIQLGEASIPETDRWRLYRYKDSLFRLELDPCATGMLADGVAHRQLGLQFFGSLSPTLGYSFHFVDNVEVGHNLTRDTKFTPVPKKNVVSSIGDRIDYDNGRAELTLDVDWFRLGIAQDNIEWGSGYRGKLILSSKPPPFPFLRMEFRPTDWLGFYYFHGWLKSDVLDTLRTYNSQVNGQPRNVYRDKYIAAHIFDLMPSKNWEIALGESIIYSDMGPQLIFLIPINFFRAADHYLTTYANGDGDNSQFFADIQYWGISNLKLYGTIFVDEIDLMNMFDRNKSRNQVGATFGSRITRVPAQTMDLRFEYTIIMPWVYSNFVQTQTYENDNEFLGYYLGDNSDEIYAELNWRPLYNLRFTGYLSYVRKGGREDIAKQYQLPSPPFLYGNVSHRSLKGCSAEYRFMRDLILKGELVFGDIKYSGENSNWKLTIQYGN